MLIIIIIVIITFLKSRLKRLYFIFPKVSITVLQ